ncbi:MAG: class I SAM-dependent methyltransferase [Thermoplasmata archaeon]
MNRPPTRRRLPGRAPDGDRGRVSPSPGNEPSPTPRARFLAADAYRAEREWKRYEGTPQRDLFRELRRRFLERHAVDSGWVADIGAGPGRFTPSLGGPGVRRVALDLSREMLTYRSPHEPVLGAGFSSFVDRVEGDALAPPFAPGSFREVALVGNALGFAGGEWDHLLDSVERLVAAGGTLIVEIAPGPGERSRYLSRLPASAVGRLFSAPIRAFVPRVHGEGFETEPSRHRADSFQRLDVGALVKRWGSGWEVLETVAVAPCLGPELERIARVRPTPKAWNHLLELEELVGREPVRWKAAAAVLLAARRVLRT